MTVFLGVGLIDTLVDSVDSTMIVFGKPTYYKPADHHVSFAVVEGNDEEVSAQGFHYFGP